MSPFPFFPLVVLTEAYKGFSIPSHAPAGTRARLFSDCVFSRILSSLAADAPQLFANCLFSCPPLTTLALQPGKGRSELQSGGDAVSAGRARGCPGARGEWDGAAVGRERRGVGEQGQEREIRRTGRERRGKAGGKGK